MFVIELFFKILDIQNDPLIGPLRRAFLGIGFFEGLWKRILVWACATVLDMDFRQAWQMRIFHRIRRGFYGRLAFDLGHKGTAVVSLISSITKLAEISETEIRDVRRL